MIGTDPIGLSAIGITLVLEGQDVVAIVPDENVHTVPVRSGQFLVELDLTVHVVAANVTRVPAGRIWCVAGGTWNDDGIWDDAATWSEA